MSSVAKKQRFPFVFFHFHGFSLENLTSPLLSLDSRGVLVSNKARQKTLHVAVSTWLGGISGKGRDLADFQ